MKKIIALVIVILIIGGLFLYFSKPDNENLTQADKEKALEDLLGRKVNLSDKKRAENREYAGKFVSFLYPGEAEIYEHRETGTSKNSGYLESFSYDLRSPRAVFNYEAIRMKSLDDHPSFRLRTLPERGYNRSDVKVDGAEGVLFKKDDGQNSERTLFLISGSNLYSFVLTGSDYESLDVVMNLLTSSLKFTSQN